MPRISLVVMLVLSSFFLQAAQNDSLNKKRLNTVLWGNGIAYASAMTGLYTLWYKDYPLTNFHFFNDNSEWGQMDKVGHVYSCYYEGLVGIDMLRWAGVSEKKAIIYGGSYGFLIQTGVEVFDGFSENWGASIGDMAANLLGSSLVIGQELAWRDQRITMKYSFSNSSYQSIRPELLGSSFPENAFKDYNGQTYWLSFNLKSFANNDSKLPPWLNVALGYGVDGFVGGHDNVFLREGVEYDYSNLIRQRQFYLSPDIDLTKIPTKRQSIRIGLRILNSIKFPLPALSFDTGAARFKFHALYF